MSGQTKSLHNRPPGPRGSPFVGSGLSFWRDPLGFFERGCAEYGDAVHYRFGPRDVVVFRHPEQVQAVLVTKQHDFVKGGGGLWFKAFAGNGLFTSEGDFHRKQRRLAQPAFHRQSIAVYGPIMSEYAQRCCNRWRDETVVDVCEEMRRLTMSIVSKAAFNADVEAEAPEVSAALTTIMQLLPKYASIMRYVNGLLVISRFRFARAKAQLDKTIYRIIAERRQKNDSGSDFLSIFMNVRDEDGLAISDTQLRDELVTLFIAGHETAANALAWTWYLIASHPDIERELYREVDRVLGSRAPTTEDVPNLRFTGKVFAESLRLYPPLWVLGRRAISDVEICGYSIPAGTIVLVSPYLTQRDPRFFPDPLEFRPDRWSEPMSAALPRFAYFPFGGGARQCLGDSFAGLEATLIIATFAQKWRMRLAEKAAPVPHALATLRPQGSMNMRIERRQLEFSCSTVA